MSTTPNGDVAVLVAHLKAKLPAKHHATVDEIGRLYGLTISTEDVARIAHLAEQINGHLVALGLAEPPPEPEPEPGPAIDYRTGADHRAFLAKYGD